MAATSLAHTVAEVAAEVEAGKNSHLRQVGEGRLFSQRRPTLPVPIYTAHTRAALSLHESGASVSARCRCCWAAPLVVRGPGCTLCCQARQQPIDFCLGIEKSRLSTRLLSTSHPSHQPPSSKGAEVSSLTSTLLFLHLPPSLPHPRPTPTTQTVNRSISFPNYRFEPTLLGLDHPSGARPP